MVSKTDEIVEVKIPDEVEKESQIEPQKTEEIKLEEIKVSAFSLSGLKTKKNLEAILKSQVKPLDDFPKEPFNDTDLMIQWNKFAQKLEDRGHKILNTLMLINDPVLQETTVIHELPNHSTKEEFEKAIPEILGYLRGMLHNHDINIEVKVNETISNKRAFTPLEKFNRLNEMNPNLELLKKTFDLDF
ncbi:MAG: DNA polymerase III subunit gamma/tau [Flavobacterium sp.]